jgi:hypothetical protein
VDVDAAAFVHLGSAGPQRPDDLLEDGDILVRQEGAPPTGPIWSRVRRWRRQWRRPDRLFKYNRP